MDLDETNDVIPQIVFMMNVVCNPDDYVVVFVEERCRTIQIIMTLKQVITTNRITRNLCNLKMI